MTVRIHMTCNGCDAETYTEPMRRVFHGFNGKGHGFGVYEEPTVEKAVEPTGWIAFDIINCTYCPECRKQVESGEAA
jgi:ribosomal protein L33